MKTCFALLLVGSFSLVVGVAAEPDGRRFAGDGPAVGADAPDFKLTLAGQQKQLHLADRTGKKPVVLMFGSFTCGPFCRGSGSIEAIHKKYQKKADFIFVYIREAHPSDEGGQRRSGGGTGQREVGGGGFGALPQAKTEAERHAAATKAIQGLGLTMTAVVDDMSNSVGKAYGAWPDRLYIINTQGKIAYKSAPGPWGFKPEEMEAALKSLLETGESAKPSSKD